MRLKNASKEYILTKKKNKRHSRNQIVKRLTSKANFQTFTSKVQPGSAQTHTSAHTSTRGEGGRKTVGCLCIYI